MFSTAQCLRAGLVPRMLLSKGGWGQSLLMAAWRNHVDGFQSWPQSHHWVVVIWTRQCPVGLAAEGLCLLRIDLLILYARLFLFLGMLCLGNRFQNTELAGRQGLSSVRRRCQPEC